MRPFEDFRALLNVLPAKDEFAISLIKKRINECCLPNGPIANIAALGQLANLAYWYAGWRGAECSKIPNAIMACFAGSNGVLKNSELIKKLVASAQTNGSLVNSICSANNVGLRIYDLALNFPTMDISQDAAMDERGCAATMAFGMETIAGKVDLLAVAAIGVEIDPVEAAVSCALYGGSPEEWGLSASSSLYPVVMKSLSLHSSAFNDSFEILRRVGSREIAAMVGAILAARVEKTPIILDGYSAMLSAAILQKLEPRAIEHCVIGHMPQNARARQLSNRLGLPIVLDMGLEYSSGAGAAMAITIVRSAVEAIVSLRGFSQDQE